MRGNSRPKSTGWRATTVLVEGQNGVSVDLEIPLSSLTYTIQAGGSLQVRVTTSDLGYHGAREAGSIDLDLTGAQLNLPIAP